MPLNNGFGTFFFWSWLSSFLFVVYCWINSNVIYKRFRIKLAKYHPMYGLLWYQHANFTFLYCGVNMCFTYFCFHFGSLKKKERRTKFHIIKVILIDDSLSGFAKAPIKCWYRLVNIWMQTSIKSTEYITDTIATIKKTSINGGVKCGVKCGAYEAVKFKNSFVRE